MKLVILFAITTLAAVSATEICAGCPEPLDLQDAKHILNESLTKLASLDGPYYRSGSIHSASQQIVAGILYRINADLIGADNKVLTCDVEIVKQPWLSNTQVTFKCPNQNELVKAYSD